MTLVRPLKKEILRNFKSECENLHGIEAVGRASMSVQCKKPIHSRLNFLFVITLPVPQFSVINPQTFRFSTYYLRPARSISGMIYSVVTSGFEKRNKVFCQQVRILFRFIHSKYPVIRKNRTACCKFHKGD